MPPSTDPAALLEAQRGCLATLPHPAPEKRGTGAVIECQREANHPLSRSPYVDSQTPTDEAHQGPDGWAWWDDAGGAVSHQAALLALLPTSTDHAYRAAGLEPVTFRLERDVDVSGVSGTGVVAWGVCWPDGTAVVRWISDTPTTAVHDSMKSVEAIHGHGGHTRVVWAD